MRRKILHIIRVIGKSMEKIIVGLLLTMVYMLFFMPYKLFLSKPKGGWEKPSYTGTHDKIENMW